MKRILLLSFVLITSILFDVVAQRTVSGKITDDTGEPLPGVNVVIKGTTTGTQTDLDGDYRLSVDDGATLVFSYVGFETQEVEVGSRTAIDITMGGALELQEVIVTAYGSDSDKLTVQQVETVESDAFEGFPILTPQEALQGQAAGVQVNGSSGILGASQVIRIRGTTSINAGNQPLFVVDGVPLNDASGGTEGYSNALGATQLNPLFDLNPADIASVSILKDASATALYGSRGANGVILITTKKGSYGSKTKFTFDYNTSWNNPTILKDPLSLDQWNDIRVGIASDPSSVTIADEGFDWLDAVARTGRSSNYSLSARGGTDKTVFYFGGSYNETDAYVIGNSLDKLNGRFNLEHKANDILKFGYNLSISRLENDRISAENSTFSPLTSGYLNLPSTIPVDDDGNLQPVGFGRNPLLREQVAQSNFISRRTIGIVYAELTPLRGLAIRSDWGVDVIQTEFETRSPEVLDAGGSAGKEIVQDNKWVSTNTINYTTEFGNHNVSVLGGVSFETARREDIEVQTTNFISDQLPNTTSGSEIGTGADDATEWALYSLFGKLNYNFANKYIVETSIRRDGSSRFGANERFGVFWAVSGGWLLSEEAFFPENDILTLAKLSASYGETGNDRINNFAALGLLGAGRDYNGSPGLELIQPANPNLTWETTVQTNIGISLAFFNDRISLDADYWIKDTEGLLLASPLPATTGFVSRNANVGKQSTNGLDISLNADVITVGDFNWSVSGNVSTLNNEVKSLPDAAKDEFDNEFIALAGFGTSRAVVGRTAQEFYVPQYIGINPQTGDPEWVGEDGNPINDVRQAPRAYVGTALPDFSGGLTNTFSWKRSLSLRILFSFVSGSSAYIADNEFNENIAGINNFNNLTSVLNYWQNPGDNAYAPALDSEFLGFWDNESSRHIYDASFVRLRNITLGYQIPKSVLDQTKILQSARIYVSGQNLATLWSDLYDIGIDPEVNAQGLETGSAQGESFFTSPQTKSWTVGVQLGF
ncbi:MAG: TonB-dependent receptor [Ekhidna sp.]|nr:TonB-dependent receptor [Ekhidna sp.]